MWLEALPALGIIVLMITFSGYGVHWVQVYENEGKIRRRNLDDWDYYLFARDKRLTGTRRGTKWL